MRKTFELALQPLAEESLRWWILGAEAALAASLFLSDGVPSALIRGLQLFLRF